MPQSLRPNRDISNGSWSDPAFSLVNEPLPTDTTRAKSSQNPVNDILVMRLSPGRDPGNNEQHVLRYRYRKSVEIRDRAVDITVTLKHEGVELDSWTHVDVGDDFVEAEHLLDPLIVANITNYISGLTIEFESDSYERT